MWEVDDQGNSATWGALVTDAEYRGGAGDQRLRNDSTKELEEHE